MEYGHVHVAVAPSFHTVTDLGRAESEPEEVSIIEQPHYCKANPPKQEQMCTLSQSEYAFRPEIKPCQASTFLQDRKRRKFNTPLRRSLSAC